MYRIGSNEYNKNTNQTSLLYCLLKYLFSNVRGGGKKLYVWNCMQTYLGVIKTSELNGPCFWIRSCYNEATIALTP